MRWYGRLRRSGEIAFVRRRGRRSGYAGFSVFALEGGTETRVCVTVSKAVGGAVARNSVRRRIKGALDALEIPAPGARLVFIAKPEAATLPYERLAADVAVALGARKPG
jgi:ribonuclease P protein component